MRYMIYAAALILTGGVFVYSLSFSRWLYKQKMYRGSIGVTLIGVLALVLPLYILFR